MNHPQETAAGPQKHWDSLTDWVRAHVATVLTPVARFLARHGVHANTVTLVGFLLQAGIGTLFALGYVRLGGLLLAVVGPMDALDGAVARANGQERPFGAFLDSTLDRLSDAVLILGLTTYRLQQGALLQVGLLLVALVSALMVSYTRARAEALGLSCKVGLLTRMERIFLIAVLSILGLVTPLAWALALLSLFTFLQRVIHVYRASQT